MGSVRFVVCTFRDLFYGLCKSLKLGIQPWVSKKLMKDDFAKRRIIADIFPLWICSWGLGRMLQSSDGLYLQVNDNVLVNRCFMQ